MGKQKDGSPILAAGGVVFDARGRIAVIHRPGYDDWCLPKGKLDKRESEMQAAVREVYEETGCIAAPRHFLGTVYYEVNHRPKLVFFWTMDCRKRRPFIANQEVDTLLWMSPGAALNRLDHAEERAIVKQAIETSAPAKKKRPAKKSASR